MHEMSAALTFQATPPCRISKKEYVAVKTGGYRVTQQERSGFSTIASGVKKRKKVSESCNIGNVQTKICPQPTPKSVSKK